MPVTFVSATPSFPVHNVEASTRFYTSRLGFEAYLQTRNRTLLVRDSVGLLLRHEPTSAALRSAKCRMGISGIRAFFQECRAAGLVPEDVRLVRTDYGKDEFPLVDPDGNTITFFSA